MNDICIALMHMTSLRVGCECMVGSTLYLVFDYGKSTLCLVFNGGLGILDYIQWSLTGTFQLFFNKIVYRR